MVVRLSRLFLLTNIPDIDDPITWHSTWGRLQAIEARMSCRMNLTSQSAIINLSTSDMTSKPTMLPSVSHAIEPAQKPAARATAFPVELPPTAISGPYADLT